ncbi:Z band alternatively spliced PDZ-motif protein 66 isoform M [Danaus plexippus plexippus]|uniref:Z band alternatively spliced PDZ-motif protein 66 isoform M n=1 Tax=Danaus plexippus plexippus TaxID=278856 RepID=A0A212ER43_DANPL|nr:Z band alternatively spliced PDZ-motif protein 66 isoform M [Danaus plexippus plexippus]
MGRMHTFVVTLRRESRDTNWGLRLVGGSDLATPLIVTRVTPGTPAGKELVRGDIIAKIDDYDARDLRHEDAQNLFRNAPKQIKLAVQRDVNRDGHGSAALAPRSPLQSVPPPFRDVNRDGHGSAALAPRSPLQSVPPPFRTPSPLPATAWRGPESLPRTPQPFQPQVEGEYRTYILSPESRNDDGVVDESITSQVSKLHLLYLYIL